MDGDRWIGRRRSAIVCAFQFAFVFKPGANMRGEIGVFLFFFDLVVTTWVVVCEVEFSSLRRRENKKIHTD